MFSACDIGSEHSWQLYSSPESQSAVRKVRLRFLFNCSFGGVAKSCGYCAFSDAAISGNQESSGFIAKESGPATADVPDHLASAPKELPQMASPPGKLGG